MPGKISVKFYFSAVSSSCREFYRTHVTHLHQQMLPQGTAGKGKEERNNGIMAVARKKEWKNGEV